MWFAFIIKENTEENTEESLSEDIAENTDSTDSTSEE